MDGYTFADLASDLDAAVVSAGPDVDKILKRAAVNIKKQWRADVSGSRWLPQFPYSITFDPKGANAYEIGPDKGRSQGPLGNLIEYGSVNNPPGNQGKTALDGEAPKMAGFILNALFDRLKER